MSHFTEYKRNATSPEDRNLGDEWADWDGKGGYTIHASRGLFLGYSAAVLLMTNAGLFLLAYLVSPRLAQWNGYLPLVAFVLISVFCAVTAVLYLQTALTAVFERNFFLFRVRPYQFFDFVFSKVFRLSQLMKVSRDRMGNSFVRVSNSVARSLKVRGRRERVLVLLPRCLRPEQIKEISAFSKEHGVNVHTVSGGELARKRVKELKPTAVVGVACERDLVSGIRDVGIKLSVIGVPNERPDGPCKNTYVDVGKVKAAVLFYLGLDGGTNSSEPTDHKPTEGIEI
jgi:hypothetical protein